MNNHFLLKKFLLKTRICIEMNWSVAFTCKWYLKTENLATSLSFFSDVPHRWYIFCRWRPKTGDDYIKIAGAVNDQSFSSDDTFFGFVNDQSK